MVESRIDQRNIFVVIGGIFFCIVYVGTVFLPLASQRSFDRGVQFLEKGRAMSPDLQVEKSICYLQAVRMLKRSFQLNPFNARVYFTYGQVLFEIANDNLLRNSLDISETQGKRDRFQAFLQLAKFYFEQATFREPGYAIPHERLGSIYELLSNEKLAESEYKNLELLDPQNITIHLYLSNYFLSKRKEKEFSYHLDKVVDLYRSIRGHQGPLQTAVKEFFRSINREDLI